MRSTIILSLYHRHYTNHLNGIVSQQIHDNIYKPSNQMYVFCIAIKCVRALRQIYSLWSCERREHPGATRAKVTSLFS